MAKILGISAVLAIYRTLNQPFCHEMYYIMMNRLFFLIFKAAKITMERTYT